MGPADRQRFAAALGGAGEYYRAPLIPASIQIYWRLLEQYPIELVEAAIAKHALDPAWGHRFPMVSDIVKQIEGTAAERSEDAWYKVHKAIRAHGHYQGVAFDDPIIHAVVDELGGWGTVCLTGDRDMPFKAKEFQRRYQTYQQRGIVPPHLPILGGAHAGRPALIGDQARAAAVRDGRGSELQPLALSGSSAVPSLTHSTGAQHGSV